MCSTIRLLHLEPVPEDAGIVLALLAEDGFACAATRVDSFESYVAALEAGDYDLVLSDLSKATDGLKALSVLRARRPELPFILFTDSGEEDVAIHALKNGATDYVLKHRVSRLASVIRTVLAESRGQRQKPSPEATDHQANELLRGAVMTSPLPMVMFDPSGRVTLWNEAAEGFFGWRADDALGKLPPTVTDENFHEFAALRDRVLRGESPAGIELCRRDRQGREIEFTVDASPVCDADGTVSAALAVITDVGEKKRIARALQKSERRFRAAFEEAACGMTMNGLDGRFIKVNRYFSNMLGYRPEELHEMDLYQVTHADDLDKSRRWIDGLLAGEDLPPQMEKRFVNRQGEIVWGAVSKKLLRDENGAPLHFINQVLDITERKNLEKQLLHAQKMEAVGTFASGIAHDFNNLLTAILGYAQVVTTLLDPDHAANDHLEHIVNAVERASGLTQSLLAFSRKREVRPRPADLNRVVGDVSGLLRRVLRADIDLCFNLAEGRVTGLIDPWQIEQVLVNLATNARDAMPDGGTLSVKTEQTTIDASFIAAHGYGTLGDYVLLTVSDNGCGMDADTLGKIFEPFFTTKEVNKGSGLGLAIVYGIVKQHGGFVTCYSEPGVGTTLRIYLPMAEDTDPDEVKEPLIEPQHGHETILLAEDDFQVRVLIRDVFERFGYQVVEAADGDEALDLFAQHQEQVALVVLDMVMPGANGKKVLNEMRRVRPQLPALVISGYTPEMMQFDQVEKAGDMTTFLPKPFAPNELLFMARKLLDD